MNNHKNINWLICFNNDGSSICSSEEHPLNAYSPILLTESGITIFRIALQLLKAEFEMYLMHEGIVISFKLTQLLNADNPKLWNEQLSSNVIFSRFEQLLKAKLLIFSTDGGTKSSLSEMQSLKVKLFILYKFGGSSNCSNDIHPLNAYLAIELTEDGICISFNSEHSLKQWLPIDLTEEGHSKNILERWLHLLNTYSLNDWREDGIDISFNAGHSLKQ